MSRVVGAIVLGDALKANVGSLHFDEWLKALPQRRIQARQQNASELNTICKLINLIDANLCFI
jgi:hypothetical protein